MAATDWRMRWRIAGRSLRWRAGPSVLMLVVAAVGVAVGTFGLIFLRGADESVLQSTLRSAPVYGSGISLTALRPSVSLRQLDHALASLPDRGVGPSHYGTAIVTVDRPVITTIGPSKQEYTSDLISRTGICHHLSFSSGECPLGANQVAMSTRNAQLTGLHVGEDLSLSTPHGGGLIHLVIAGLFGPPDNNAPYWWGTNYFGFGLGGATVPLIDDDVISQSTALALSAPGRAPLLAQIPVHVTSLSTGTLAPFLHSQAVLSAHLKQDPGIVVSSSLPQLARRAAGDEHTTTTIVMVVLVQMVLLALIVLYFVAAGNGETRQSDVELADLRGYSRRRKAGVAYLEPLAILTMALPLGVAIAWVGAGLAAPTLFLPGVHSSLNLLALGAACLCFLAGAIAMLLGTRGLLRDPRSPSRSSRRAGSRALGLAVDAVAVSFALAAFVEVAVTGVSMGDRTDPLAAVAPGLLAFGVGVAGARLLPLVTRAAIPPTRNSPRVATALAARRIGRMPHLSRHVIVISMAVGLATFAVSGWAVAGRNRTVQSGFEVGADRVLTVQVRPGVNFLHAVRRADPGGRRAMAVVVEQASDGQLLAVDASRLAAVANWPDELSASSISSIARDLRGSAPPPIDIGGQALRITADLENAVTPAPQLQATVFDKAYQTTSTIALGQMRPGLQRYQASIAGDCPTSCRLVSLGLTWSPASASSAQRATIRAGVRGLATETAPGRWSTVPSGLTIPRRWQSQAPGVTVRPSSAGLTVRAVVQSGSGPGLFGPFDVPSALPAVTTPNSGGTLGVGLDGSTISLKSVADVPALPGGGAGTPMVDLSLAELLQSGPMLSTQPEVWLSAGSATGVVQRLHARGITVLSTETAVARNAELSRSGIALAFHFFLLAAIAATVLAIGATIFAVVGATRRRVDELAALQAVGLPAGSLRRSLLLEHGLVVGAGIVLGAAAGLIATSVALPSVPEFVTPTARSLLEFQLPWGPIALVLVVTVVAMAATVIVTSRLAVDDGSVDNAGRSL